MNKSEQIIQTVESINEETKKRIPPEAVASAARHGLELRKKHNQGGTGVGVRRAHQLANRSHVSDTDVKSMHSYHSRHAVDADGKDWDNKEKPSAGRIAYLLWGGAAGKKWAKSERDKLEKD